MFFLRKERRGQQTQITKQKQEREKDKLRVDLEETRETLADLLVEGCIRVCLLGDFHKINDVKVFLLIFIQLEWLVQVKDMTELLLCSFLFFIFLQFFFTFFSFVVVVVVVLIEPASFKLLLIDLCPAYLQAILKSFLSCRTPPTQTIRKKKKKKKKKKKRKKKQVTNGGGGGCLSKDRRLIIVFIIGEFLRRLRFV
jgi:hypothetical protein